ncbi:MAG: diguanylate cyclase [Planctomycetota bacterium]
MDEDRKHQVIVVEDDTHTRKLLVRQLEAAGYIVADYPDGRAALQPITAMGTGIVVADWRMPGVDGLELCRAVRELQAMQALGNVFFVLLSARTTKEDVVRGLEAGANDYLTKPYHRGELLARIAAGERMLRLQDELVHRTLELQKTNAQMAVLANRLQQLADTDSLTGLGNRRCLFQHFEEAWELAQREGYPLSCVMLDVDHFKRTNDTHGHAAGDQVLAAVAETIRNCVRRPELCGRFGGEEFVVVCPGIGLEEAAALAERIRVAVAERPVGWETVSVRVSVSAGVAQSGDDVSCPDDLVRHADAMLYLAKEHGRNQTWAWGADGRGYAVDGRAERAAGLPAPAGPCGAFVRSGSRAHQV